MNRFAYGKKDWNKRLSVDHIIPGDNSVIRALCYSCNAHRGHAERSDEEVLRYMKRWYEKNCSIRFLFWLNTSPGEGGRENRNEACAKRDAQFRTGSVDGNW